MSPPTVGHGLVAKKVMEEAIHRGAEHVIYLSKTQDKKKNPLPVDRKVFWAKKMFPGANIVAADNVIRTFVDAIKAQSGKYKKLVVIAGSDRIPEYKLLLDKYNGKDFTFDSIEVVSAGERDPDSDGAAGMSATKMRVAASTNDIASFKRGLPSNFKDSEVRQLMKEVRAGMGISEGTSFKDFLSRLFEARGTCWKGYKQLGYKKKDGKSVPNCVPEN
jgi:nicotinic acid mononucleotide adenylyltransferase